MLPSSRSGLLLCLMSLMTGAAVAEEALLVNTEAGPVRGRASTDGKVKIFLGIPYAAPPVGPLRWKPPQPVAPWAETRDATQYGPYCHQSGLFKLKFLGPGPSEDCLTLNIWSPAGKTATKYPVMVWIHGGGFTDGGSAEPSTSGENLAHRGVVVVSMNYRLNVFGFFATHELADESPQHAAGNYGLLDQSAAIQWAKRNIAAFGGDPGKLTIFGESAGSVSVNFQMASPLTRDLISGAIGESGGGVGSSSVQVPDLATKEKDDEQFAKSELRATSLAALRALNAADLAAHAKPKLLGGGKFVPDVDGYFLTESLTAAFAAGRQAHVPLLAGWNADETSFASAAKMPNFGPPNLNLMLLQKFGLRAGEAQQVFPAMNNAEAVRAADDLSAAEFLVFGTWGWLEGQVRTGTSAVYRYFFALAPPAQPERASLTGAFHSAEIEYVFGTFDSRQDTHWRPEDRALSEKMQAFWTNFAKNGDPNGPDLPVWPRYGASGDWLLMELGAVVSAHADDRRARFLFLQKAWSP